MRFVVRQGVGPSRNALAAVSRPSIDLLKRRDGCRERCDYHRNSEKYDGGTVPIPLVTHEGASTQGKNILRRSR